MCGIVDRRHLVERLRTAAGSAHHAHGRKGSEERRGTQGSHRPPHALGPGVVLAVPDVPPAAGRPARRPAPAARGRPVATPTSCSTGRWRWSTTTSRCGPRPRRRCAAWPPRAASPMGPWYILMDEFLVSGETHRAQPAARPRPRPPRSAGAMDVGYLPDMFGHVAQMPQLLAPVRLRARGRVAGRAGGRRPQRRSGGRRPTARPCGPSTCPQGYGNGALVPDDAKALVAASSEFEDEQGRRCSPARSSG